MEGRATAIKLTDFRSVPMRTFHITWFSFFICFFGWFGIAPLMTVLREEFALTKAQMGNLVIASVSVTIFMRLFLGWLCDRLGPRKTYAGLLFLGAIPVMTIGFADTYMELLVWRCLIGSIGAAFVLTQYHTSVMFAPNVVGTANATTAGWGNLGAGFAQMAMPLLFATITALGYSDAVGWRASMTIAGVVIFLCGFLYLWGTEDSPVNDLPKPKEPKSPHGLKDNLQFLKDRRIWILAILYGACFGIELTTYNVCAVYFHDEFQLGLAEAGLVVGIFGLMNIFGRTLGGVSSDFIAQKSGLKGRSMFLGAVIFLEGVFLMAFSQAPSLPLVIIALVCFGLFVQLAEGATFSLVPFINKQHLGLATGIVGAGGNLGAVAAGVLVRSDYSLSQAFAIMGITIIFCSVLTFSLVFSKETEQREATELRRALRLRLVAKLRARRAVATT